MVMSSRPSTSRASDLIMHLRGSLGSDIEVPVPRPREAFQRLRDSSFASVVWVYRCGAWRCAVSDFGIGLSSFSFSYIYVFCSRGLGRTWEVKYLLLRNSAIF